jgi:hypothetical protein
MITSSKVGVGVGIRHLLKELQSADNDDQHNDGDDGETKIAPIRSERVRNDSSDTTTITASKARRPV